MYKLFIDDERWPTEYNWVIARSSMLAMRCILDRGIPTEMALDHDLGGDDTIMIFLKEFEEFLFFEKLKLPENFKFSVHSQNPIGAKAANLFMLDLIKQYNSMPEVPS